MHGFIKINAMVFSLNVDHSFPFPYCAAGNPVIRFDQASVLIPTGVHNTEKKNAIKQTVI